MATDSAFTVTKASDYATLAKQYAGPNQKKSVWEEYFLEPTQQYYQQQAQAVKDIASYDISSAYANYQKQQLQLARSSRYGSGASEQLSSELSKAYEQQAQQIRASEQTQLAKVQEGYSSALGEIEGTFSQYGETAKQFEEAMLQYGASKGLVDLSDTKKLYTSMAEGGYELYSQTFEDGALTTTLTGYGKDLYDRILHSQQYSRDFAQYLSENQPDLYEAYTQNQDFYNAIVSGLDYGDRAYNKLSNISATFKQTIASLGGNYDILKNLYGNETGEIDLSDEDMRSLAQNLNRTSDYVDSASGDWRKQLSLVLKGTPLIGKSGEKWNIGSDVAEYSMVENVENLKTGDIIYRNGEYRYVTSVKNGKATYRIVYPGNANLTSLTPIIDLLETTGRHGKVRE